MKDGSREAATLFVARLADNGLCLKRVGRAVEMSGRRTLRPPNGSDAKLRGQGPRAEADAALGVHACESRDAGRAPP